MKTTFKKCNIVLLSIKENTKNCIVTRITSSKHEKHARFNKEYITQEYLKQQSCQSNHLYILSNENIKKR